MSADSAAEPEIGDAEEAAKAEQLASISAKVSFVVSGHTSCTKMQECVCTLQDLSPSEVCRWNPNSRKPSFEQNDSESSMKSRNWYASRKIHVAFCFLRGDLDGL